jgi:hypothetical protein
MIPFAQTWTIVGAICDALFLIVFACVFNCVMDIDYYQMVLPQQVGCMFNFLKIG